MTAPTQPFRFVTSDRRVREDRRFVAGKGRFAADIALPGTRHVALVTSPHPAARILAIDRAEALAELVPVEYEPLPFVLDGEEACAPGSPLVHAEHGSNVLLDRTFVWGEVENDFAPSPHHLSMRVEWGRSSTVPVETFGVLASWDPWREILDVFASVQMPRFPDQLALALPGSSVRVHNDVDVGGSYGVKRGIKHAVLTGYLSRRLGFPVRLIEDRLENMRGGDAHGPERNFDLEIAFDDAGVIRSMKMRALDNVGAYAGRSPFQLGKPVDAREPANVGGARHHRPSAFPSPPARYRAGARLQPCDPGSGTVINPKIVRGMTMGGIAHGIGAALYEEFAYNEEGQLVAQSFMDYLLPSAHEVPAVEIVHHVTPSPHTVLGQKGSGESGYLGAPAAIASAVNDASRPLGIVVNRLPIRTAQLGDMIAQARGHS